MKRDQNEEMRLHIEGFVNSFISPVKVDRYISFLLDSKKRSKFTDTLNHGLLKDLLPQFIVAGPPKCSANATAYLISDEKAQDDQFVEAQSAVQIVEKAYFGTIASIIPGVLALVKEEAPAEIVWLYRPNRR
jgi:hypothetical protein